MENNRIIVVPYSDHWATVFNQLKAVFSDRLKDLFISIEHVGSTAVPGLSAKPIIDTDIIIKDKSRFEEIVEILDKLGYTHQGDMGIPGRAAFKRRSELTPEDGSGRTWPQHHLYVCLQDSVSLKNHLSFRDFLRANPRKAKEYGALKLQLAKEYPLDIDSYIEGKTKFITAMLESTGFSQEALSDITAQNKAPK
ncbi:GrpB family protein [Chitinophaga sp. MM2321]|uniref:GrpB family protein n=1 Tax=Chitinophaga sp. MM2321 TaxID=3137178 RepID=UPI0032D5A3D6